MAVEIINSSSKTERWNFMSYELQISDGSVITVWARPNVNITSVVRSSRNLRQTEECDGENIYAYRGRYYQYIPGFPYDWN